MNRSLDTSFEPGVYFITGGKNPAKQEQGTMDHFYRLRIHFNNGFAPTTVPILAADNHGQAQDQLEAFCDRIRKAPGKYTHIKSIGVLAGRKRIALRTFVNGMEQ